MRSAAIAPCPRLLRRIWISWTGSRCQSRSWRGPGREQRRRGARRKLPSASSWPASPARAGRWRRACARAKILSVGQVRNEQVASLLYRSRLLDEPSLRRAIAEAGERDLGDFLVASGRVRAE